MRDCARVRHAGAALLACALLSAHASAGEEKEQCIRASDQGQQLRDDGKYKLAREAFVRCARTTCPGIVSHDCAQWLVDVDARSPTVVIDAKDDKGADLVDVKVQVDGAVFVAKVDGLPTPIDPGEHLFRYEAAGFPPVENRVVIRTAEKNRVLQVRFAPEPPSMPTPPAAGRTVASPSRAEPAERPRSLSPPLLSWVLAGGAVAAFMTEAYFGLAGLGQRSSDLSGPGKCAPNCSSSEKSSIQTKFAIADASLAIGIVSAGLAAYFFLRPREAGAKSVGAAGQTTLRGTFVDFAPSAGGGMATVGGHF
jgi:hypothetical protein